MRTDNLSAMKLYSDAEWNTNDQINPKVLSGLVMVEHDMQRLPFYFLGLLK